MELLVIDAFADHSPAFAVDAIAQINAAGIAIAAFLVREIVVFMFTPSSNDIGDQCAFRTFW